MLGGPVEVLNGAVTVNIAEEGTVADMVVPPFSEVLFGESTLADTGMSTAMLAKFEDKRIDSSRKK